MRPLHSSAGDFKLGAVYSQQSCLGSHNHKPFRVSYLYLLQLQEDLLHHNMHQQNICKMYFCHWEPLGVFGSCQTRIPEWSNPRVDWTNAVAFWCAWEQLGALATNLQGHRRSGDNQRSTWERWQQAWEHLESL